MLYFTFGFKEKKILSNSILYWRKIWKTYCGDLFILYLLDVVLITASSMIFGYNFLVCNSYEFKKKNKSLKNGLMLVQNHDLNSFESTIPADDYTQV